MTERLPKALVRPMVARDPREAHRAATPLELLYDLCFVVAIAQAAAQLHHATSHGHAVHALLPYCQVFFAIWWAWMGFTWFASAFDPDDVPYRLKALLQIVGVLILAAGVPRAFEHGDWGLIVAGYVVMRVGLVAQWLRAARANPELRRTAHRYALGIVVCQVGWVAGLWAPEALAPYDWFALVALELLVPAWAEKARGTPWHPHHIAERYGLLTIIVIGESVLAATLAIQGAVEQQAMSLELLSVIVAAPVLLFGMWWIYFLPAAQELLQTVRGAFAWGYGHVPIFASAAAVGAGLAVQVDVGKGVGEISPFWAGQALAIPVAVFLISTWAVLYRPNLGPNLRGGVVFGAAALVLLAPLLPCSAVVIAAIVVAVNVVAVNVAAVNDVDGLRGRRASR